MEESLRTIPLARLALAFIPVGVVIGILFKWSVDGRTAIYAVGRMLLQLLLIGYVLATIFESDHSLVVVGVLCIMLVASSWIALRPVKHLRRRVYIKAFLAIGVGGTATLLVITQAVLDLPKWYQPDFVIPLAGMIYANSMNAVSLAAERFESELKLGSGYVLARQSGLNTALIPLVNTLFAVGIVSLPGMMTGQILSGVEPLVAARYQIMVMCMVFGAAGLSTALYLHLMKSSTVEAEQA